jgi:hypothetical protein
VLSTQVVKARGALVTKLFTFRSLAVELANALLVASVESTIDVHTCDQRSQYERLVDQPMGLPSCGPESA